MRRGYNNGFSLGLLLLCLLKQQINLAKAIPEIKKGAPASVARRPQVRGTQTVGNLTAFTKIKGVITQKQLRPIRGHHLSPSRSRPLSPLRKLHALILLKDSSTPGNDAWNFSLYRAFGGVLAGGLPQTSPLHGFPQGYKQLSVIHNNGNRCAFAYGAAIFLTQCL